METPKIIPTDELNNLEFNKNNFYFLKKMVESLQINILICLELSKRPIINIKKINEVIEIFESLEEQEKKQAIVEYCSRIENKEWIKEIKELCKQK